MTLVAALAVVAGAGGALVVHAPRLADAAPLPTATTPLVVAPAPAGATRVAAIPAVAGGVDVRVSVDGDVAAWSTETASGSTISVATGDQVLQFSTPRPPLGLSVGHVDGGAPLVLFSQCPPGRPHGKTRKGTCDLYRLSSLDAYGTVVPLTTLGPGTHVRGASTASGDELAPSLSGNALVFARWPKGSTVPGAVVVRDVRTGRERRLPPGPRGDCARYRRCGWTGVGTTGPVEVSASGDRYAHRWTFFGGAESAGVDSTNQVRVGKLTGSGKAHITAEAYADGDGSATEISDLQLIGTTTQVVWDQYDPDDPPPAPGTHSDVLRSIGNVAYTYDDPSGRRIVSAAATPTALWLILDAAALPAGTRDDDMPDECSAAVDGCVVERMPLPTFKKLPTG